VAINDSPGLDLLRSSATVATVLPSRTARLATPATPQPGLRLEQREVIGRITFTTLATMMPALVTNRICAVTLPNHRKTSWNALDTHSPRQKIT